MYKALEVAKFIITFCTQNNIQLSNLKLQKALYFLWVEFFKDTGKSLFDDDICAWGLGPAIPNVYYKYCPFGGKNIQREYSVDIDDENRAIIEKLLPNFINMSAKALVMETHKQGTSWDEIYRNGLGNRSIIPKTLIIEKIGSSRGNRD